MNRPTDNQVAFFARTNFRNSRKLFGIRQADRLHHMYVIGKTGTGKSTLLETLMREDLRLGNGFALLDPHGDLAERVREAVPEERREDLIYFDAADMSSSVGYNPLAGVPNANRAVAASGILDAFKKLWADSWGPRLEHILRNALIALLDYPGSTLADILRMLDDKSFRKSVASRVYNPTVRGFWLREYEGYTARLRAEAIAPVQNKVGAFLAHPGLHQVLTQRGDLLDLRSVMDRGRILLVNLSKGRLGADASWLLGALLVSGLASTALSRADVAEIERRDFFIYLDEFHNFVTQSLAEMLSELRKYRVGLVLAHQYLFQLELGLRDAVLGNVGTLVCFRVGFVDAEALEKELEPVFRARDLVELPNYQVNLRLMIDGRVRRAFSGATLGSDATERERPAAFGPTGRGMP